MARFTKSEKDRKIKHAKDLYIKGFDIDVIADMLGISVNTLRAWAAGNDFDTIRRAASVSISEIRNEILLTYEKMKNGEQPAMSPDQISKLTASLEKLSPTQKSLSWIIEAFNMLTDEYLSEIQKTTNIKKRESLLTHLKQLRLNMDIVITKTTKQIIGD